jgi:hypothetical protein
MSKYMLEWALSMSHFSGAAKAAVARINVLRIKAIIAAVLFMAILL